MPMAKMSSQFGSQSTAWVCHDGLAMRMNIRKATPNA
jgi:hypothetical protein